MLYMKFSRYETLTKATDDAESRYMQAILVYKLICRTLILVIKFYSCIPSHFLAAYWK